MSDADDDRYGDGIPYDDDLDADGEPVIGPSVDDPIPPLVRDDG